MSTPIGYTSSAFGLSNQLRIFTFISLSLNFFSVNNISFKNHHNIHHSIFFPFFKSLSLVRLSRRTYHLNNGYRQQQLAPLRFIRTCEKFNFIQILLSGQKLLSAELWIRLSGISERSIFLNPQRDANLSALLVNR